MIEVFLQVNSKPAGFIFWYFLVAAEIEALILLILDWRIVVDIHSKKGDTHKQATAVSLLTLFISLIEELIFLSLQIQVAGQAELNFNNSSEVLERAAQVRKRRFLRAFYAQITNSVS